MGFKCVVPGCRSNYRRKSDEGLIGPQGHIPVASFPVDKLLCEQWLKAIKREDYKPTQHSKVCILHFLPEDVVSSGLKSKAKQRRYCLRIRKEAIPSLITVPDVPSKPAKVSTSNKALKRKKKSCLKMPLITSTGEEGPSVNSATAEIVSDLMQLTTTSEIGDVFPFNFKEELNSECLIADGVPDSLHHKQEGKSSEILKNIECPQEGASLHSAPAADDTSDPLLLKQDRNSSSNVPPCKRLRGKQLSHYSAIPGSNFYHLPQKHQRKFETLDELLWKLNFLDKYWTVINHEDGVLISHISCNPHPKIALSVMLNESCAVRVFVSEVEIQKLGSYSVPSHINDMDSLEELLTEVKKCNTEKTVFNPGSEIIILQLVISMLSIVKDQSSRYVNILKLICEQLNLMIMKKLNYSNEFMVFSSLLYNCSPQGYKFLRNAGHMILPCYTTVRTLTLSQEIRPKTEQQNIGFWIYVQNKFKSLTQEDKTVVLLVNEVFIKQHVNCKDGKMGESAFNCTDCTDAAKSALVFMVSSVRSKFKDVVHILPVQIITAEELFTYLKEIVIGLEELGFQVICISTDNSSINTKAMSLFHTPPKISTVYIHPVDNSRPLFFLFDSVDIIKSIRKDWLNLKNFNKCLQFPEFSLDDGCESVTRVCCAPFTTVKKLHAVEMDSSANPSHKLTTQALMPSILEKQNVNYALHIFNIDAVKALLIHGEKHGLPFFDDVAKFIKIVCVWWTVMNVKSTVTENLLNDKYGAPLTNDEKDENYLFLHFFLNWLNLWEGMTDITGKLSKETLTPLKHTTTAILQITDYCLDELDMKFILTGKFHADELEQRFGQYQGLSGCNYYVPVGQKFDSEKESRNMSILKIPFHNKTVEVPVNGTDETDWEKMENNLELDMQRFHVEVTEDDIEKCLEFQENLVYFAGYCCFTVLKKMKCDCCRDFLACSYTEGLSYADCSRSNGLLYPDDAVVNIIVYNYIVVNKLTQNIEFAKAQNQRNIAAEISLIVLFDNDAFLPLINCDSGHCMEEIQRMLLWTATDMLLKKFYAIENGTSHSVKGRRKERADN